MKYGDLIQFEPIESVVRLRDADASSRARELVSTYVISERMAEQLAELVLPHLQFLSPQDNKALLVVGNYGTGKSHLMAVLSAVAEHGELADALTNPLVVDKAGPVAGRFKVVRTEIGATEMSLRGIITAELEAKLIELGVAFVFPRADEVTNNKDAFHELMAAFTAVYPEHGLLLVVDELLDYLRTRKDQALILDLNFLRELGEVCKGSRFRFVAGVQETLFDNPRFQFVAETLRRVKDRFEQIRIIRDDVAYVVEQRLLKKDARQRAKVREHLENFASLYGDMNERMEKYVALFPVHPAYLDTFERVYVAEKREILKTLSVAIKDLVNKQVPEGETGLVAYDSYWNQLRDNASFRSIPEIREVVDKSVVLESRIKQAYTRPAYKAAALRIIHALSVHRLTTGDIYTPLGATAEELRDDLCLMLALPERNAEFLRTMVETILREIVKTVSGQFLSYNTENGQFFLDLKKDVDFDSLIEKKAEGLEPSQLDRYYFDALAQAMECKVDTYVPGYKIWEHGLEWREHKVERPGYLFFGAPNERSTAQPPRDFYLYFLQAFDAPYFKDEGRADEVLFRLKHREDAFDQALRLYAGAKEQAATASGGNKTVYESKAGDHLRRLTTWLREHMTTAFEVTHQGRTRTLAEVIQGKVVGGLAKAGVKERVDAAGATCLAGHFHDRMPDYPVFSVLISRENRGQACTDALRWLHGAVKPKNGAAVLDALELLDGEVCRPANSRYAKHVLGLLQAKAQAQVLNRSELVQEEYTVEYWSRFRLEPEFLAVVLAALLHNGDIELGITGKKLDASAVEAFARLPVSDLAQFKYVGHPRGLPLGALQALFELLGVPKGLITQPATHDEALQRLQARTAQLVEKAVLGDQALRNAGPVFWGKPVLSEVERSEWTKRLGGLKRFLETLQPFNSAAKLKGFPHEVGVIQAQGAALETLRDLDELVKLVHQLGPDTAWLATAEAVLPESHDWRSQVNAARGEVVAKLSSPAHRADAGFQRTLGQTLAALKGQYILLYLALHKGRRLGAGDDEKKARLTQDPRLRQLQKLSTVEMMPGQQLTEFVETLSGLKTCFALGDADLQATPLCPHCAFRPIEEELGGATAHDRLVGLDDRLDTLVDGWTTTLLANLADPLVAANLPLVADPAGRKALEEFLAQKTLPEPLSSVFVKALQEVLGGLEKVLVATADVKVALVKGGVPCTVSELRERFEGYVASLTKGKDASKIRVVVE